MASLLSSGRVLGACAATAEKSRRRRHPPGGVSFYRAQLIVALFRPSSGCRRIQVAPSVDGCGKVHHERIEGLAAVELTSRRAQRSRIMPDPAGDPVCGRSSPTSEHTRAGNNGERAQRALPHFVAC